MTRDVLRACLVVVTLAACASIVLETRERLIVLDHTGRLMAAHAAPAQAYAAPAPQPQPEGRLRTFGRAAIDMADAALGIVR